MSSTSRGGKREEQDFYETRREDSIEFFQLLATRMTPTVIVEPMAGRGALVRVMREVWPNAYIVANELNLERAAQLKDAGADLVLRGDMFRQSFRKEIPFGHINLVATNPAFLFALQAARVLIPWADHTTLLQRLGWLGSDERLPFWKAQSYDFGILANRPSFAASLSCARYDGHGATKVKRPCGWAVVQYLDAPRAKTCPDCGEGVNVSTSDSADYAWYDFYAESLNQHYHLGHVEPDTQGSLFA